MGSSGRPSLYALAPGASAYRTSDDSAREGLEHSPQPLEPVQPARRTRPAEADRGRVPCLAVDRLQRERSDVGLAVSLELDLRERERDRGLVPGDDPGLVLGRPLVGRPRAPTGRDLPPAKQRVQERRAAGRTRTASAVG